MPRGERLDFGPKGDLTEYGDANTKDAVHYDPDHFPDVRAALDLINTTALLDERTACIQHPSGNPDHHREVTNLLQARADGAAQHRMRVISFDIDLTLRTGLDYETNAVLIEPSEITRLQGLGYIVGTCSDRTPTDQKDLMDTLQQAPHFCIPKEMLEWTRKLIPAASHLHIGDDDRRDRRDRQIAEKSGWQHQWPDEYQ